MATSVNTLTTGSQAKLAARRACVGVNGRVASDDLIAGTVVGMRTSTDVASRPAGETEIVRLDEVCVTGDDRSDFKARLIESD